MAAAGDCTLRVLAAWSMLWAICAQPGPQGDQAAIDPELIDFKPVLVSVETGRSLPIDEAKVVPGVVDSFMPSVTMRMSYGKGWVEDGVSLYPFQAENEPVIILEMPEHKIGVELFTLVMVDPDAPSPDDPSSREWLHWMKTNIDTDEVYSGRTVVHYNPPTPPKGKHRYVFVLFKQPYNQRIYVEPPKGRASFDTRTFADEHGLGPPVSVKFFFSSPKHL